MSEADAAPRACRVVPDERGTAVGTSIELGTALGQWARSTLSDSGAWTITIGPTEESISP